MGLCRCFYSFTYFLWTIYDFKMVVEPFETLMWPCAKIYLKEYFEFIIPLLHWIFWWRIKYYSLLFSDFYEMWHPEYGFNSDNIWNFFYVGISGCYRFNKNRPPNCQIWPPIFLSVKSGKHSHFHPFLFWTGIWCKHESCR